MGRLRRRLWPRDRLAIALLLYVIWIPLAVALIDYAGGNEESGREERDRPSEVAEERGPADFAEAAGWTWGVLWIGYAALAAWLARVKGRDPLRWGLASLLTFIALFPFLAAAPELHRRGDG